MDNERKVFNVEEEPIGIKPLEGATPEVEQSDEIKLVRENPVEPEAKPEVKVVNTASPSPVRIITTGGNGPVKVVTKPTSEVATTEPPKEESITPVEPPKVEPKKEEKKDEKWKDVIMYIIMVIIIILIILLLLRFCCDGNKDGKGINWPSKIEEVFQGGTPGIKTQKVTGTTVPGIITISTKGTTQVHTYTSKDANGNIVIVTSHYSSTTWHNGTTGTTNTIMPGKTTGTGVTLTFFPGGKETTSTRKTTIPGGKVTTSTKNTTIPGGKVTTGNGGNNTTSSTKRTTSTTKQTIMSGKDTTKSTKKTTTTKRTTTSKKTTTTTKRTTTTKKTTTTTKRTTKATTTTTTSKKTTTTTTKPKPKFTYKYTKNDLLKSYQIKVYKDGELFVHSGTHLYLNSCEGTFVSNGNSIDDGITLRYEKADRFGIDLDKGPVLYMPLDGACYKVTKG